LKREGICIVNQLIEKFKKMKIPKIPKRIN
jgi:hypothetical protein